MHPLYTDCGIDLFGLILDLQEVDLCGARGAEASLIPAKMVLPPKYCTDACFPFPLNFSLLKLGPPTRS